MDKQLQPTLNIESRPIDELGDLDTSMDDLMTEAEMASAQTQRFVLCFDATSSMGHVWSRATDALKQSVDYIKENAACNISIKIIAYRDHEYDHNIVDESRWSNDTDYLKNFIANVRCSGGGDYPESIGHGLALALGDQAAPSQIILIGDAPGKPGSMGFAEATECGQQSCPIYGLYTDQDSRLVSHFEKLAKLSGGKAMLLSPHGDLSDIFKLIISKNKALQITYQATSIEGKRMEKELA